MPELALPLDGELPELAGVAWRPRVDERSLARRDRGWTFWTVVHLVPFLAIAAGLPLLSPFAAPLSLAALAFAWFIPALYAARGAQVLAPPWTGRGDGGGHQAEQRALGLLGDLVGHDAREAVRATGFVVEPGRFGTWVVGPAGALLVRPGARRVSCWCVRTTGDDLPRADRVAHLLLALRADEPGFATVANGSFSGARWRVRRALRSSQARAALDMATARQRARARARAL